MSRRRDEKVLMSKTIAKDSRELLRLTLLDDSGRMRLRMQYLEHHSGREQPTPREISIKPAMLAEVVGGLMDAARIIRNAN